MNMGATDSREAWRIATGTTAGEGWRQGHPLHVAGCMVMLCRRGSAGITINSRRYRITAGCMVYIVFDMVAVPSGVSDDFEACFLSVDFDTTQDVFFLVTSNRFWDFVYRYPVFKLRRPFYDVTDRWFGLLGWIAGHCSEATAEKALRNETENFMLVMAEQVETHLGTLGANPPKNRAWALVNEFIGLLNRYCTRRHDVAFYAGKLNITPNYLNIIVRKNIGTTAKEQINVQLGLVVKMLLDTTDLTVKEIAERLHYDDPSYLCRIFRKQTSLSPINYRNKLRSL